MTDYAAFFLDELVVGASTPSLPASGMLLCRVHWRYASQDGRPMVRRLTRFGNVYMPPSVGSVIVADGYVEAETNAHGEGEIQLYRGCECDVVISGTSIVRRITVPDLPQAELIDLIGDAPDMFSVQRAFPAQPIRRTI